MKKIDKWQRQFMKIDAKSIELMREVIMELGIDHPLTDQLDNISIAAVDAWNMLERMKITKCKRCSGKGYLYGAFGDGGGSCPCPVCRPIEYQRSLRA